MGNAAGFFSHPCDPCDPWFLRFLANGVVRPRVQLATTVVILRILSAQGLSRIICFAQWETPRIRAVFSSGRGHD